MIDLNSLSLPDLFRELTKDGCLTRLIDAALEEDLNGARDITTRSLPNAEKVITAEVVTRRAGVISGLTAVSEVVSSMEWTVHLNDGDSCNSGSKIATLTGPFCDILSIERVLLNILSELSGIATTTRSYVDAVAGTNAKICDTRKTPPGMRNLAKYAVRCGGGTLHRLGLFDAALFKDNHLATIQAGQMKPTLEKSIEVVRKIHEVAFVEVETDTIEQLIDILKLSKDLINIIMLDNMTTSDIQSALALRNELNPDIQLEASGGITLKNVRAIAETGVDRIAVGAITHSAPWLDIGLDIQQ